LEALRVQQQGQQQQVRNSRLYAGKASSSSNLSALNDVLSNSKSSNSRGSTPPTPGSSFFFIFLSKIQNEFESEKGMIKRQTMISIHIIFLFIL
jgi:hypothetical protein